MTRLDHLGRSYSAATEILRFWESFIFVPTCVVSRKIREWAGTGKSIFKYDRECRDRAGTGTCFPPNSVQDLVVYFVNSILDAKSVQEDDLQKAMHDDILSAFVEICNRVVSSISRTRDTQNWFILCQFYRLWNRLNLKLV